MTPPEPDALPWEITLRDDLNRILDAVGTPVDTVTSIIAYLEAHPSALHKLLGHADVLIIPESM